MKEIAIVWILTLVSQMPDGSLSVGAMAKENRRACMRDLGEVAAMAEEAKTQKKILSYAIECNVIELEIVRKFQ